MIIIKSSANKISDNVRFYEATGYPVIDDVLQETYGTMPFQENVMKLYSNVVGISFGKADVIRRIIAKGKRYKDQIPALKKEWLDACLSHNIDLNTANNVWLKMVANAAYQFNESHAVEYSQHSAKTSYYKFKYPIQFAVERINLKQSELSYWTRWLKRGYNVDLNMPDINKSKVKEYVYDADKNTVLLPLISIKGLGEKLAEKIVSNRPFQNFEDMQGISRFSSRVKLYLALAGSLDSLKDTRKEILDKLPYTINYRVVYNKKGEVMFSYHNDMLLQYEILNGNIIYTDSVNNFVTKYEDMGYTVKLVTKVKAGKTSTGKDRWDFYCDNDTKYASFYFYSNQIKEGCLIAYKLNKYKYLENYEVFDESFKNNNFWS